MLRPNLCDYSDIYIVAKETIDLLAAANENHKVQKDDTFKIICHLGHPYQKLSTH